MTINTTIGKTYAVTSATECIVTTPDGTLIATCQPGIQTCIIAPTTQIDISDPAALVTETFKGVSAGSSAAGGVTPLRQTLHSTAAPRDHAYPGIYLTAQHTGTIKTLSIHSMKEKVHTGMPIWVKAYRILSDGSKEFICLSTNKCQPDNTPRLHGGTYTWSFPPIPVNKNDRLALVSSGDYNKDKTIFQPEDQDIVWFDASIRDIPESDDFIIKPDGSKAASALPEYLVTYSEIAVNGVPVASNDDLSVHEKDAVKHITSDERTAWNNKADTSALSSKVSTATFNAHTGNAVVHTTAEDKTKLGYIDLTNNKISIGDNSNQTDAIVIGNGAVSSGIPGSGICIGKESSGTYTSISLGYRARCESANSISIGFASRNQGRYSVAIGEGASITKENEGEIGYNTVIGDSARTYTSYCCSVIGSLAYCNRDFSIALGYKTTSYAERSVVIGSDWTSALPNTSILSATDGLNEFGIIGVEKKQENAPRIIFGHYDKLTNTTKKAVAISIDNLYTLLKANGGLDYNIGY